MTDTNYIKQEPVAWKDLTYGNLHHQDFGNSIPLYAAQQPVEQEPVAYFMDVKAGFSSKHLYEQVSDEYKNDADVFPLYAAPQPMQEPVAWAHPSGGYLSARYMKEFATGLEKETYTIPLYAAPVQQVDLTDDEILLAVGWNDTTNNQIVDIGRAVIAAYKEKQK